MLQVLIINFQNWCVLLQYSKSIEVLMQFSSIDSLFCTYLGHYVPISIPSIWPYRQPSCHSYFYYFSSYKTINNSFKDQHLWHLRQMLHWLNVKTCSMYDFGPMQSAHALKLSNDFMTNKVTHWNLDKVTPATPAAGGTPVTHLEHQNVLRLVILCW